MADSDEDASGADAVPEEVLARRRIAVLRPILDIENSGQPVRKALEDAAWELELSTSHTWRLYNRLKGSDARTSALLLDRRGPKKGRRRLNRDAEIIINDRLKKFFLVRERPSFLRIVREIRAECVSRGFVPPARETIKARLDAMDEREVLRKRRGAKVGATAYAARPGRLAVEPTDRKQAGQATPNTIAAMRLAINRLGEKAPRHQLMDYAAALLKEQI